ncbi:N-acyl-aromatic-L-amino acid amidohydrolase (carboxylate-forming) [Equus caballus]|uniref:N-acyl-aromatic-L-amino acid amidohydrolase (carboxylate-forming) n=1 Tax=Equus caballus TaxID=9796 RepID=UPI0038B3842A
MLGSVAGVKADAAAEQLSRKKSHNGTQELSNSVAKNGTALELGPQPQGVPPTKDESPSGCSSGRTPFPAFQMETYRLLSSVDFPRPGAGDLAGTVHPQLQGSPPPSSREGHLYERESTVSPRSISEAAHSEKGIAFVQTEQLTFSMPTLPTLAPAATHHP